MFNLRWDPFIKFKHIFSFEDQLLEKSEDVRVAQLQRIQNAKDFCKNSSQILPTNKKSKVVLVTDPEQRLAYCHVPKVASSAWMIIFSDLNRLPTKLHLFEKDISINDSLSRKKKLRNFAFVQKTVCQARKTKKVFFAYLLRTQIKTIFSLF